MRYETTNLDAIAVLEAYAKIESAFIRALQWANENDIEPVVAEGEAVGYQYLDSSSGKQVVVEPDWSRRALGRGRTEAGWQGECHWHTYIDKEIERYDNLTDGADKTIDFLQSFDR